MHACVSLVKNFLKISGVYIYIVAVEKRFNQISVVVAVLKHYNQLVFICTIHHPCHPLYSSGNGNKTHKYFEYFS